jgi:hypothetical protein
MQTLTAKYGNQAPVIVDYQKLKEEIKEHWELYTVEKLPSQWDQNYHYGPVDKLNTYFDASRREMLCVQYILVLDALNFCFWPTEKYEYGMSLTSKHS